MIIFLRYFTGALAGPSKDCFQIKFSCDGVDVRASVVSQASKKDSWIARCAKALTPLVVAAIIFPGSVCNAEEQHSPPIANAINRDLDLEVSVVATTESPPVSEAATVDAINLDMRSNLPERCLLENTLTLSLVELPHRPDSSPDDALEWTGDVGQSWRPARQCRLQRCGPDVLSKP